MRGAKLPLAKFLLPGLAPFDPAQPDAVDKFDIPAELKVAAPRPLGN